MASSCFKSRACTLLQSCVFCPFRFTAYCSTVYGMRWQESSLDLTRERSQYWIVSYNKFSGVVKYPIVALMVGILPYSVEAHSLHPYNIAGGANTRTTRSRKRSETNAEVCYHPAGFVIIPAFMIHKDARCVRWVRCVRCVRCGWCGWCGWCGLWNITRIIFKRNLQCSAFAVRRAGRLRAPLCSKPFSV